MNASFTEFYTPELLQTILDHSLTNIYAAKAVRDSTTGELVDFTIYFANPAFLKRTHSAEEEWQQHTLLTLFPTLRQTGFFEHYRRVVETGEPFEGEQEYPGPNGHFWYQTSVKKLGDGIVVNFVDITDRRHAEETVRQQHLLLDGVVNTFLSGLTIFEPVRNPHGQVIDFRYTWFNEGALLLIPSTDRQNLIGRTLTEVYTTEMQALLDRCQQVYRTGEFARFEQFFITLGKWIDISIQRIDGGLLVACNDITDRKLAEQQLQQTNQLLTQISQSVQIAISTHEPVRDEQGQIVDFRYTFFNEQARQWLPVDWQAVVGKTVRQMGFTPNADQVIDRLAQVVETGEPTYFDATIADGRIFYNIISPLGDGTVSTFIDVTAQRQTAQDYQNQAEQLRAMLDASISSILAMTAIRDTTGHIVDFHIDKANRSVERSLSKTPQELEGHTLLEMFPGNIENGFFELYAKAADTGITQQATLHYIDVNGFEGWFEVCAVQQAPDKIVLTFMNVTESKQLEQRLRESNASLGQFASIASHDLQEPLRKIATFGDMLINEYGSQFDERGVNLLDRMQSSALRMQALIRDLLTYSRLSQHKTINRQTVNLNQLISDVLVDLEVAVEDSKALLTIGELPSLSGDPSQLRQVFQNLLSNALKFIEPGKTPHITLASCPIQWTDIPEDVIFSHKSKQTYWQITVADNGIGFKETYRERIFGAFERLHSKSSPYSGTGIGLAIAKRVVENHGGAISAQSSPGLGATFYLYLPA